MSTANVMTFNVLVTFARMGTTVCMGLYATRLLVESLGKIDYGIYGLLGGGAAMLLLVQASLVLSAQRHMAHEIGRDDQEQLRAVFSTSLVLFAVVALLLTALGAAMTPLLLDYLEYPAERREAVAVTWYSTLVISAALVMKAPFNALFMARQFMAREALLHGASMMVYLGIALAVHSYEGDRLIFFGVAVAVYRALEVVVMGLIAARTFDEGRLRLGSLKPAIFRELLTFGGWGFLDALAWRMRQLGGNLILNPFFGPSINAAYSVGSQVQMYEYSLAWTITRATNPVIIQKHAAGNLEFVRRLILSVCRISSFFAAAACMPFVIEMEYIIDVWLEDPPPGTALFCRVMLLTILCEQLACGFLSGIQAVGRVGVYHSATAVATFVPMAVAWIAFRNGFENPQLLVQLVLAGIAVVVGFRAWYVGRILGIRFTSWLGDVVGRVAVSVGTACTASVVAASLVEAPSIARFVLVATVFWGVLGPMVWLIGAHRDEKEKAVAWLATLSAKLRRARPPRGSM
ncbi:MAG: hypothetical protein AAGA92_00255 [Planctomycetota bacterium]